MGILCLLLNFRKVGVLYISSTDCFDLAKLHFDRSNIVRSAKIIYCTFMLAMQRVEKSIIIFCI